MSKMKYCVLVTAALMTFGTVGATTATAQSGFGQSFTVPDAPNTFLTAISASGTYGVHLSEPFLAQIFRLNESGITGPALFTQSLGSSFDGFSLTPNLNLAAGARYIVLPSQPTSGSFAGASSAGDAYLGGSITQCVNRICSSPIGDSDMVGFSVTFATPPVSVPEPSTYALLASGLALLSVTTVRRKRVR